MVLHLYAYVLSQAPLIVPSSPWCLLQSRDVILLQVLCWQVEKVEPQFQIVSNLDWCRVKWVSRRLSEPSLGGNRRDSHDPVLHSCFRRLGLCVPATGLRLLRNGFLNPLKILDLGLKVTH